MARIDPEHEAARVLREHGSTRPPVPVERIARDMGVRVAFEPFEGEVAGMLFQHPDDGQVVIVVNSASAKTRQRFSVAHEVGHLRLHERPIYVDRPVNVRFRDERSSLAIDHEEIAANRFAAALLMPEDWLLSDVERRIARQAQLSDEAFVEDLARRYEVSRQAMEFRLANLGLWTPL
jgi:Zn-dependent peptidase ImmA (M78 family)